MTLVDSTSARTIGSRARLVLSVSLPRLARHFREVLAWIESHDVSRFQESAARLAAIPGAEGLAVLAQLPEHLVAEVLEQSPLDEEGRSHLRHIAARLAADHAPESPAAALLTTFHTAADVAAELEEEAPAGPGPAGVDVPELESLPALAAAVEAWEDEETAIRALTRLASVVVRLGGPLPAEFWLRAADRLPPAPDAPRLRLLLQIARILNPLGQPRTCLDILGTILPLWQQIGDVEGKAATLHEMARAIAQQGDMARAMDLWNQSLVLVEQIGDVRGKAATLHNMAGVIAQQGDVARAMDLWNQSLVLFEQIGDVEGKAATLSNMAGVIAQEGDMARAMVLWNESLVLEEQIGDVQGKAATLNNMAWVIAQQGDVARAMDLWNQSLVLKDQIGDIRGKAATLANMASAAGRQGDAVRQRQVNLEAARALAAARAWPDAVIVLGNLGVSDDPEAAGFLAQALWLALRVEVPVDRAVKIAAALVRKVGAESPAALLAAGFAMGSAAVRGESHPKKEDIQTLAAAALGACAEARGVTPEKVPEWLQAEGLNDPGRFLPALGRELEAIVGTGWLFDPAALKT